MSNNIVTAALRKLAHGSWCKPRDWEERADFALCVRSRLAEERFDPYPDVSGSEIPERINPIAYRINKNGWQRLEEN